MHSQALVEIMRMALLAHLHEHRGNVRRAAEALMIGKTTLYRKIKELGIRKEEWEGPNGSFMLPYWWRQKTTRERAADSNGRSPSVVEVKPPAKKPPRTKETGLLFPLIVATSLFAGTLSGGSGFSRAWKNHSTLQWHMNAPEPYKGTQRRITAAAASRVVERSV